jgi:hypothetical protein
VNVTKILLIAVIACLALRSASAGDPPAAEIWAEHSAYASEAKQNWWHRFWADVHLHRNRVNAWPEPFNLPDRESVRDPFRTMADNGWRLQNTFGHHLFASETNELTYAGQLKLHWLLTQVPPHRRQIYVLEADHQPATTARVASIYHHLAQIAPEATACPVQTTRIVPRGGDGSYLDNLDQTYRSSMPLPRLPGGAPANSASSTSNAPTGSY